MDDAIIIDLGEYQIWLRAVHGSRITPRSTEKICSTVVDIMPCIDHKLGGLDPEIIWILSYNMAEQVAGLVINNEAWSEVWEILPNPVDEGKYLWGAFRLVALTPSNRSPAGPLYRLETVNSLGLEGMDDLRSRSVTQGL
jgi:hypothetical protein